MNGVVAIVQARMSSRRLPGKVLKPILGRPMLALQIERVRRATRLDGLVVATSDTADDDAIVKACGDIGVECFRGSLDDVLDRFYRCAFAHAAEHVVRLTADCPLADPTVIDRVVRTHMDGGFDYTSNVFPPTWPDGLDVEVVRFGALADAWREAELPSEREHVTYFIETHPQRFRYGNVAAPVDHSGLRWTVDDPEDFELVRRIYEALYPTNAAFTTDDILALIQARPNLRALNAHLERNASMATSLEADRQFLANRGTSR